MKAIYTTLFVCISVLSHAQFNPQTREITEKFYPDFDVEINTPAFQKEKGFTNYDELMEFIEKQVKSHPKYISYEFIGESQKGRKIPLLKINDKSADGEKLNFWIQGGMHGNEPASTEGVLYLIDRLLNNPEQRKILEKLNIEIIPMANIDGYEKQVRDAANGLDLNRDQTKLQIKESILLKKAFTKFNADVALDFHEYRPYRRDYMRMSNWGMTGAFDVMFLYSANLNVPQELREFTKEYFVNPAKNRMEELEISHHDYFSSTQHYGEIQLNQGSLNSRSSATSYALANCISTLIEVRGVALKRASYKRRVLTTYEAGWSYMQSAASRVAEIKALLARTGSETEHSAVVKFSRNIRTEQVKMLDLEKPSMVDTLLAIRDAWGCTPKLERKRPLAYILLPGQENLVEKLKILGVDIETVQKEQQFDVQVYEVTDYFQDKERYEGVKRQYVETTLKSETRNIPPGSSLIRMDQPHSNFAVEVLEPEASNSFITWDVLHTEKGAELPIYRYLNKENL